MPEGGEQRGLLQTEVEFNGVRIAFMTTHLDHRSDINRQIGVANRRIDYAFYSNGRIEEGEPTLRPTHMVVINSRASDHLPICAELEVVHE